MKDKSQTAELIVSVLAALLVIGFAGFVLGRRSTQHDGTAATNSAKLREPARSAAARPVAPAPIASAAKSSAESTTSITVPSKWRFAGISQTHSGKDSNEWMSFYSAQHMAELQKFNLLHPYAWNAYSAAQIEWMAQNGFPMPEDVFAANAMSDDDLWREAATGSPKAQMLYYERLEEERAIAQADATAHGVTPMDFAKGLSATQPLLSQELSRMLQIVDKIQTPYLGYVEAGRTSTFGDRTNYIQGLVGGLALAYARGDDRAADAISATGASGDLSDEEADLAVRIVLETRNAFRTAPCDPRTSTPFPKPGY